MESTEFNPLNWELVIVFNNKHDNSQQQISSTIKLLSSLNLVVQVNQGELDPTNIFILVGAYEIELRRYAKKTSMKSGIGVITSHTIFSEAERLHLIENMIQGEIELKYLYNNKQVDLFAYHQPEQLVLLRKSWYRGRIFNLPSNIANSYFGEDISFYFLFLNFYNFALFLLSFIGIPVSIIQYVSDPYMISGAIFSILLSIFSSFFLEIWKRFSSIYSWNWMTSNFMDQEQALAQYKTHHRKIGAYHQGVFLKKKHFRVDDELVLVEQYMSEKPYMSRKHQRSRDLCMLGTFSLVTILIVMVAISTIAIFSLRLVLRTIIDTELVSSALGSVISACFIQLFNFIYRAVAYTMTEREGHRIQSTFNESLTIKLFLFQFVNTFSSLFYIAFVRNNIDLWGSDRLIDKCSYSNRMSGIWQGCVTDLEFQIFSILLVNFVTGLLVELLLPIIQFRFNKFKGTLKSKKSTLECEEQYYLPTFDTFDEYNEIIIQFALISMFAAVLPFSPLLALINNILENKIDAYKLCYSHRRPLYKGSDGIGYWYKFLVIIGIVSVITNSMLIGFSFPTLLKFTNDKYTILWIVLIMEHVILLFKWVVSSLIPDETTSVRKKRSISSFIKNAILDKYLGDHSNNQIGNNTIISIEHDGQQSLTSINLINDNIIDFVDYQPQQQLQHEDTSPISIISNTFQKIEQAL